MKNSSIEEIAEILKKAKKPLFISHENPDGDTYGAAFGIRAGMEMECCPIACASQVYWPFSDLGVEGTITDIKGYDADLYVFLDCADEYRCGELISEQLKEGIASVNIDHHVSNTFYSDYNYVYERSSTCELVFDILTYIKESISKKTADYLYMGVASDSGLFVHGYTTPETHYTAARLMEFGADFEMIGKILFRTVSIGTAQLTGKLYNNMEIVDGQIVISYVTEQDFIDSNSSYNDSEGLISHLTSIDKMKICVLLKQVDESTFKASLRSTRDYDISKLALANGGGGHKQAAGCRFTGSLEDVKKQVVKQIYQLGIL
ncbi:MAG: bifunctional oligoribonuclease/PAP phosphatase NrnA [Clostridia bacterium]|nr:bifunctional oligoribonuclease/PAP phosphatase NrnA [Clostridia bacterium]